MSALPAAVVRSATPSLQRSGLLCMAARALSARQAPLTHNRLCDVAGQFARAIPEGDEEAGSGFLYRAQRVPARLPAAAAG